MIRETIVARESGGALYGVVERTTARAPAAVVYITAGLTGRAGPRGVYRRLAESLCETGSIQCRFDLAGIGDSVSSDVVSPRDQRSVAETRAVLNELTRRYGVQKFVLLGLCSGADIALLAAQDDPRVAALVLLNGSLFASDDAARRAHRRTALRFYSRQVLRRRAWIRLLADRGRPRRAIRTLASTLLPVPGHGESEPTVASPSLSTSELLQGLRIPALLVYSEGSVSWDVYRLAIKATVERATRIADIRVRYLAGCDHVFTTVESQSLLVDTIRPWLEPRIAAGSAGTPLSFTAKGK